MLTRALLSTPKNFRCFGSVYTWGSRTVNLGHQNETKVPQHVDFSAAGNIVRASMGQYHTLLLNNQGELFGLGCGSSGAVGTGATDLFDAPQKIKFGAEALNVVDFDAGKDFSVAVTSNGSVFTWGKSSTANLEAANPLGHGQTGDIRTPTKVEALNGHAVAHVAAGDYHSVAVSKCGHHLWMWGNGKAGTFCDPFVKYLPYPTEVEEVNQWLHHEHKSIKDVKAAGDSTVVLTSDNELWGWGGNEYGQLANNHDRLMLAYKGVYEPYHITGYDGTIKGFDLSSDVIVFWTDANIAYWAGRYQQFVPKAVTLPIPGKITNVGATQSGFAITTDDGNVYSFGEALETDKKFFDQHLSLSRASDFGGKIVTAIGGAFENRFAITN